MKYHYVWYTIYEMGYVILVSPYVMCDIWACYVWCMHVLWIHVLCIYVLCNTWKYSIIIHLLCLNWKVIPCLVWWMKFIFHIYMIVHILWFVWDDVSWYTYVLYSFVDGQTRMAVYVVANYIHRMRRTWMNPFLGEEIVNDDICRRGRTRMMIFVGGGDRECY